MNTCQARRCIQNRSLKEYNILGSRFNDFRRCNKKVFKDGFCKMCYEHDNRSPTDRNKIDDQLWKRDGIYGEPHDFPFHTTKDEKQWVQMIYELHPTINPENEYFWKKLNDINDRKEMIEILKKNLTDEEIIYLCEKI